MAPLVGSTTALLRLYHHIFLPQQLPQREDEQDVGFELFQATEKCLKEYQGKLPQKRRWTIDAALNLLAHSLACHKGNGDLDEVKLLLTLGELKAGHSVALRVRSQNAGILISHKATHVCFEAFELSPQNESVLGTHGRLERQFPGCAVAVDLSTYKQEGFVTTLAHTITQMSSAAAPGMQPQIRKQGRWQDEDRDTTNPRLVTQLLLGAFLRSCGQPADVNTILKHTRDDVQWNDAEIPWRRSPTWTLIRATLQLVFSRMDRGSSTYKEFMCYYIARLFDDAHALSAPFDITFGMNRKAATRLAKLIQAGSLTADFSVTFMETIQKLLKRGEDELRNHWDSLQRAESQQMHLGRPLQRLIGLNFAADALIALPHLDEYITVREVRESTNMPKVFSSRRGLLHMSARSFPEFDVDPRAAYATPNLKGIEDWVRADMWKAALSYDPEYACQMLLKLLKQYHISAEAHYIGAQVLDTYSARPRNPEGLSLMLLCLYEVWVAIDKLAVAQCELLKQYLPGISIDLFSSLLLRNKPEMKRLHDVEAYFNRRIQQADPAKPSIFSIPRAADSFAASYYDTYGQAAGLHALRSSIETSAERARDAKLEELESRCALYNRWKAEADRLVHMQRVAATQPASTLSRWRMDPVLEHDLENCNKCILNDKKDRMRIKVEEWPLPSNDAEAKALIFELRCPSWYSCWRDATAYLCSKVLKGAAPAYTMAKGTVGLKDDPKLHISFTCGTFRQVILWTTKKHTSLTHRSSMLLTQADASNICVPNGSHYEYFMHDSNALPDEDSDMDDPDQEEGQREETLFYIDKLKPCATAYKNYVYPLPPISGALQRFLERPSSLPDGPAPNAVIADVSTCPQDMTIDEFKELCCLGFGQHLQWLNIIQQLRAPAVIFEKEETVSFFLQCVYQAGTPLPDTMFSHDQTVRTPHAILLKDKFAQSLLDQLDAALLRCKKSWEAMNAVVIFAAIASRLLSLTLETHIRHRCLTFLASARRVAYSWMQELGQLAQASASDRRSYGSFLLKRNEAALLCCITFDVGDHLSDIISSEASASVLWQCSFILAERRTTQTGLIPLLFWRFQRILHDAFPILRKGFTGLNHAIAQQAWPGFHPLDDDWEHMGGDVDNEWVFMTFATKLLHVNMITGEFLVDGMRLMKPPTEYEEHPTYHTLFGTDEIEVRPSDALGMRYLSKNLYKGWRIDFALLSSGIKSSKNLVVQTKKGPRNYELLPSKLFDRKMPEHFVQDYVHWLVIHDGSDEFTVQFRPKSDPWNDYSDSIWTLSKNKDQCDWQLHRRGQSLLGLENDTMDVVAEILAPLVKRTRVHLGVSDGEILDINIPSLELSFTLTRGSASLCSKEFRGMVLDADQSLPSLSGLKSRLVLIGLRADDRLLLLPEGPVSYVKLDSHVEVRIDRDTITKIHAYEIDQRLERFGGSKSLQSHLLLAYFHALTSFSLPDPLTRRTGTEQALRILRSAAVRSFAQLSQQNADLLARIARLTPGRCYYPPTGDKVMQKVTWDEELSPSSQHAGFVLAVRSIFDQAKKQSVFHPAADLRLPRFDHVDRDLLIRDMARSMSWPASMFDPHSSSVRQGVRYDSRDKDEANVLTKQAYVISRLLSGKSSKLHYSPPASGTLWKVLSSQDELYGADFEFNGSMLQYDATLLSEVGPILSRSPSPAPYVKHLLSFHGMLKSKGHDALNLFGVMIWLSTMAFSESADMATLQLLAMIYTSAQVKAVPVPSADLIIPKLGNKLDLSALRKVVDDAAINIENCPPDVLESLKMRPKEMLPQAFQRYRLRAIQEVFDGFAAQSKTRIPSMPDALSRQHVAPYIDVEVILDRVKPIFKRRADFHRLQTYCQEVERTVLGLPLEHISRVLSTLPQPNHQDEVLTAVDIGNLFSGHAPCLAAGDPQGLDELEGLSIANDETLAQSHCRLEKLIQRLQATNKADDVQNYLRALADSHASARTCTQTRIIPSKSEMPAVLAGLEPYLQAVRSRLEDIRSVIVSAICLHLSTVTGCRTSLQWPQISNVLLLEQLNRRCWPKLSEDWKKAIISYAGALASVQRAERLVEACSRENIEDLVREWQNIPHQNWEPIEHPESLLLEVEKNITIREVQRDIAAVMLHPPDNKNAVMQLNMGEGKSSVITPIVAAELANGRRLVRVVVAKPQSKQMAQMMISSFGNLIDRRIFYMPYSRALRLDEASAKEFKAICKECEREGGVLLVQPEHIMSFSLAGPESFISGRPAAGKVFMDLQEFFDQHSRDIIDESDENFSVRFELIYTMGLRRPVEYEYSRWTLIQKVLDVVQILLPDLVSDFPSAVECITRTQGGFPRLRILSPEAMASLIQRIAEYICAHGIPSLPLQNEDQHSRMALIRYMTKLDLTAREQKLVEDGTLWSEETEKPLLLLRGLLATGILEFALCSKRWRVNFGLAPQREPSISLAVPFSAKDQPSPRSEFCHPEVVILLTSIAFFNEGLTDRDIYAAFAHLKSSDHKDVEYSHWLRGVQVDDGFKSLRNVNLKDQVNCASVLFPQLRFSKGLIDYFLAHIVFSAEMKEYPKKLTASGCDLGKVKAHPTTGYSGTNDTRKLLPSNVTQLDLPAQMHTNALVLLHLLQDENAVALMPDAKDNSATDAERLIDLVMNLEPMPYVILDVGAQILELNNAEVASMWLAKLIKLHHERRKSAVVYCNDDELTVLTISGHPEPLAGSSYESRLDQCAVYLDECHTRGLDLKLPSDYRAAVTLGPRLTNDRMKQACMRMRKLGMGQTITFCIPREIAAKIWALDGVGDEITVSDVLQWVIGQTSSEMRHDMTLWAAQNHRFAHAARVLERMEISEKHVLTRAQALRLCEKEARSIKDRYWPMPDKPSPLEVLAKSDHPPFQAIVERCREFGMLEFGNRKLNLTKEQEQEQEQEIEVDAEREIQKAPAAIPEEHRLHPHVVDLVRTGKINPRSSGYKPAFQTLEKTSAAQAYDLDPACFGSGQFLATSDFARTVLDFGTDSVADSYQRPIQWILSIRKNVRKGMKLEQHFHCIVVISPFEAEQLYQYVEHSPTAALHLYRARYNRAFPTDMDKMDLYTVTAGEVTVDIPLELIVQLNVFAGQLYISSYEEYEATCRFMGLSPIALTAEMEALGWKVDSHGFILSDERGRVGGESGLKKSPTSFLKLLIARVRRHGEDISKTDMGRLLDSEKFDEQDFERVKW